MAEDAEEEDDTDRRNKRRRMPTVPRRTMPKRKRRKLTRKRRMTTPGKASTHSILWLVNCVVAIITLFTNVEDKINADYTVSIKTSQYYII